MKNFATRLWEAVDQKNNAAMVGLDPRPDHFPEPFRSRAQQGGSEAASAMVQYHRELLDVLAPKVPVIKPQAAFFEAMGMDGYNAMLDAVAYTKEKGMLVVLDAKRGDIGSTSTAYAEAYFSGTACPPADALTINPYLGEDACQPFLEVAKKHGAGLFILVKTSNPGAGLFQDHGTPPLADRVAEAVHRWGQTDLEASGNWSSVGAVVGATRPAELEHFRKLMPNTPLLLPGFGFQGGSADGLQAAFNQQGHGGIVNSSRGILWAHEREDLQHLSNWQGRVDTAVDEMIAALAPVQKAGVSA
jgi:orotidine-5'-phosphate decarboxylase